MVGFYLNGSIELIDVMGGNATAEAEDAKIEVEALVVDELVDDAARRVVPTDDLGHHIAAGCEAPGEDGEGEPLAHAEVIIAIFSRDDTYRQYEAEGHERGEMLLLDSVHSCQFCRKADGMIWADSRFFVKAR